MPTRRLAALLCVFSALPVLLSAQGPAEPPRGESPDISGFWELSFDSRSDPVEQQSIVPPAQLK